MIKEEIKAEITKLEAEAKQLLANANFINGAIQAFYNTLAKLEAAEQAALEKVKEELAATPAPTEPSKTE